MARHRLTRIGLDVGTHSLRAVQLVLGADGRAAAISGLARSVRTPLPSDAPPEEQRAALRADVRRLLSRGNLRGRGVVLGMDPPQIELHALSLPLGELQIDDPKLISALRFELSRNLSFDAEQAEVRAWRLPAGTPLAPTVVGVCAQRERMAEWFEDIECIGRRCVRADASACALVYICQTTMHPEEQSIWAVLDVGERASRLVVAVQHVPILQREVAIGMVQLIEAVAADLGVEIDAAAQLVLEHGISRQVSAAPAAAGSADAAEAVRRRDAEAEGQVACLIFSGMRKWLAGLADEVERSLAYAMQIYVDLPVSGLYLVGGGSLIAGLAEFLGEEIGVRTSVVDALAGLAAPQRERRAGGAWAKAVGLALLSAPPTAGRSAEPRP